MKSYKYLVINGCSQAAGQGCDIDKVYGKLLSDKYGLELVNLATPSSGWHSLESTTIDFVENNPDIVDDCFFILQQSMLEREFDYNYASMYRTDVWEKYNMNYVPKPTLTWLGFNDFDKYTKLPFHRKDDKKQEKSNYSEFDGHRNGLNLLFLPEHKHYPNSRHLWKNGKNHDIEPPYIHGQFNQLMKNWGRKMYSFHLLLNELKIDHLMVDGYSPFLSYKLNFRNYYDTDDEFEFVKRFWSTEVDNPDDEMVYDFKNNKGGFWFDSIDSKYKIDDVVLWSLYQFKDHGTSWNIDGGHAGPKGMKLIADVIEKNLKEKGWF